jgi:hypothetical protein
MLVLLRLDIILIYQATHNHNYHFTNNKNFTSANMILFTSSRRKEGGVSCGKKTKNGKFFQHISCHIKKANCEYKCAYNGIMSFLKSIQQYAYATEKGMLLYCIRGSKSLTHTKKTRVLQFFVLWPIRTKKLKTRWEKAHGNSLRG